jgi:hypothetical protein
MRLQGAMTCDVSIFNVCDFRQFLVARTMVDLRVRSPADQIMSCRPAIVELSRREIKSINLGKPP